MLLVLQTGATFVAASVCNSNSRKKKHPYFLFIVLFVKHFVSQNIRAPCNPSRFVLDVPNLSFFSVRPLGSYGLQQSQGCMNDKKPRASIGVLQAYRFEQASYPQLAVQPSGIPGSSTLLATKADFWRCICVYLPRNLTGNIVLATLISIVVFYFELVTTQSAMSNGTFEAR